LRLDVQQGTEPIGEGTDVNAGKEIPSFFGNTTEIIYELELRIIAPAAMAILDLYRKARVASDSTVLETAAG
jgi:hypothetical protein